MTTTTSTPRHRHSTHEVFNQPPPLQGYDLFTSDVALRAGVERVGGAGFDSELRAFGEMLGREETIELGHLANRYPPVLRTHDRFGHRIDEVEFHPAWHELMTLAMRARVHNLPWTDSRPGRHVARATLLYLLTQVEAGVTCPLSMTCAVVPSLRQEPEVWEAWRGLLAGTEYESRLLPGTEKAAVLMGMAMTEKQGGSDVRANTTRAVAAEDGAFLLTGHKWFCSAPTCDAFLTLAQTGEGLSCFLVPRFRPDGGRNRFLIQRLKDKLGNRSNASSEIEYSDTWAQPVGPLGRGVPTILEMVTMTRLDCVAGAAGLVRQAVAQACHHARHRSAFGRRLAEQPLMQNVLADLAVESEAMTLSFLRLASAYDRGAEDEEQRAFARLATAVLKYWVCKRGPMVVGEALECHGGSGYVEESILPRLYREAPLASIWEGSGNVICLDVLRAMERSPEVVAVFFDALHSARRTEPALDRLSAEVESEIRKRPGPGSARRLTETMALLLQAALLLEHGDPTVAEAFCRTRVAGGRYGALGTLPEGLPLHDIVERATPAE